MRTLLITLLIGSAFCARAQTNPVPGFLLTNTNDTVPGWVDDRDWDKAPATIAFRREASGPWQSYAPTQARAVIISGGDRYESRVITYEVALENEQRMLDASDQPAPGTLPSATDTAWLTVLVQGDAGLYAFKDARGKQHFFLETPGRPLTELIMRRYVQVNRDVIHGDRKYLGRFDYYKNQLATALADCPTLRKPVATAKYERGDLQALIAAYDRCNGRPGPLYTAPLPGRSWQWGLTAGAALTNLDFNRAAYPYLSQADFGWPVTPVVGLHALFYAPRQRGKWAFYNELRWKRLHASAQYERSFAFEQRTVYQPVLKFDYIGLVTALRYTYPGARWRGFVQTGLVHAVAVAAKNEETVDSYWFGDHQTEIRPVLPQARRVEQGLVLGAGAGRGRLAAELRYEFGNGMVRTWGFRSWTQTLAMLIHVRF